MRLAEALVLRADHQKRYQQLKQRLLANARVQEGEDPAEDPQALLIEINQVLDELTSLVQQINRTNLATLLEADTTLTDALARRDVLALRRAVYSELATNAAARQDRYSPSEIKYVSTVSVSDVQRQADALAREYRELDTRIQEVNWSTDLIE